ncbi:response regulator transcription factor [Halobacteriovorax sp. RT-2-6]|uniref:response regulator transcription factor n=1 Tax=unclassified Halobacteriovorax TaxID=2639665 RepID=UPI00399998DE
MKALIVEDEQSIAKLIGVNLKAIGIDYDMANTGNDAITAIENNQYELFVLDRMLPDLSGVQICQYIRNTKKLKNVGILFVTALTSSESIIEGLDAGADDYITKPFDIGILKARVSSLKRRVESHHTSSPINKKNTYNHMGIKVDVDGVKTIIDEKEIKLTVSEFKILCVLISSPGKVFTRKQIVDLIKGENIYVTDRTVDTHVFALRKKLGSKSKVVETVRGIGYRVKSEE